MRILFTGGSSFTGCWFVQKLAAAGHRIVAPIRRSFEDYNDQSLRKSRIEKILPSADVRFEIPYGSKSFQDLIENESFDLFCHHAAEVNDYKSPDFDYISALKNNAGNLPEVLTALKSRGCQKIVLTGSVFEQNEGAGSDGLRAVSPYGLSKGLTADVFHYFCQVHKMPLGKFVIPNPFGPFEEFRFTSFLMQNWMGGKTAHVAMPAYVRDNIPVSLLGDAYVAFVQSDSKKLNPSCYVGTQGDFTQKFAENMRVRLNLPCEYTLGDQTEFLEPRERFNTEPVDLIEENKGWDELAAYYERVFAK
jgi:UDP-glucose 4-epimerase